MRKLIASLFLLASGAVSAATVVPDQSTFPYVTSSAGFYVGHTYDMVQTFTVGVDGTLASVDIAIGKVSTTTIDLEFSIWSTQPNGLRDTRLAHIVRPVEEVALYGSSAANLQTFDVLWAGIDVAQGDVLAITMAAPGAGGGSIADGYYWRITDLPRQIPRNDYLGGTSQRCYYVSPDLGCEARNHDYLFATSVQLVPVPPAMLLFGSALAGLGWIRKKA